MKDFYPSIIRKMKNYLSDDVIPMIIVLYLIPIYRKNECVKSSKTTYPNPANSTLPKSS